MNLELESMAVEMPHVAGHPNRVGFRGVLTIVDEPSDRPPAGARGHRVLLTRRAAEAALPSLLGMGVDYASSFDRHDTRKKVGVITRAEVVGSRVELSGHLFAKDFPEIVRELRADVGDARKESSGLRRAGVPKLGMSYEIADAQIEDLHASVWTLTKVTFTGAAILRRDKAAYRKTWIALSEE